MKKTFIAILLALIIKQSFGQDFSKADSIILTKEINVGAANFRTELAKNIKSVFMSQKEKDAAIEFAIDTFKINQFMSKQMYLDSSNIGAIKAMHRAEYEYDKLIKKLSEKLSTKFSQNDKIQFAKTQKSWLTYRENERLLCNIIVSYTQGTIYNIYRAEKLLEITKERALELYSYLLAIYTNEEK